MKKSRHFIAVIVLIGIATGALYIIFSLMFRLPVAASAEAGPIDVLFNAHYWIISFLFALIMVIMLYSAAVFRRRPGDDTDGPHIHGHTGLEVGWTILPTLAVVGMGIWAAIILNDVTSPKANEMVIGVEAGQWFWRFHYPEQEDVTSGELVLPVNQPVLLEMEANDVLHSFWVPEFRVKQDLVPGQMTRLRFTPTLVGEYKVRCAEICGTGHAQMLANVRVVSDADFVAWVEESTQQVEFAELGDVERGQVWYAEYACNSCHSVDGTATVGPTWLDLYGSEELLTDSTTVVVDDEYITQSILEPNAHIVAGFNPNIMPQDFGELFAQREEEVLASQGVEVDIIEEIIAFIQALPAEELEDLNE